MIFRALAGKPIVTWNGGRDRCNIMRVEDFCTGLFGLLKNENAYGEAVNICGDESPCWRDVISTLADVSGVKIPLIDLPREFIQKHYPQRKEEIDGRSYEVFASNEKLKKLVPSFSSTISLRDGIARTVASYRESNFQNGVDWTYDARCDEIINAWRRLQGQSGKMRFVNYLRNNRFESYAKYLNAMSGRGLGFRWYRKFVNAAARLARGWK
ncbi:MAG: hypothetical protein IKJ45_17465 [Kiritimatiellae bacterium]|nr:hypothetical protein [Kiritimatiellia bacterium]